MDFHQFPPTHRRTWLLLVSTAYCLNGVVECFAPSHFLNHHCRHDRIVRQRKWQRKTVPAATIGLIDNATRVENDVRCLWNELVHRLQGDFDNYHQVVQDRERNRLPREGGGHEHIHAVLMPVVDDNSDTRRACDDDTVMATGRLAAYYFNGKPEAIFRFRYYQLVLRRDGENEMPVEGTSTESSNSFVVDMILYTLHKELELELRKTCDPTEWARLFEQFEASDGLPRITTLPKCDIRWSTEPNPVQHAYLEDSETMKSEKSENGDDDAGIHAVMVHGEAVVNSQMVPGQKMLIRDQLSLFENQLFINDRGYQWPSRQEKLEFIYGNQRGIPYRLDRVTYLRARHDEIIDGAETAATGCPSSAGLRTTVHREMYDDELKWTLGPLYRQEDEYEVNMDRIGGIPPPRPTNPG